MKIEFYKYHGAGNDFILIDNRSENIKLTKEQIAFLCHRRFGIGADGLMLLNNHAGSDFLMDYYNSDGSGATMCGNGGRCIVAFARDLKIVHHKTTFYASDGAHEAFLLPNGDIKLKMIDVEKINVLPEGYFVYTGSPHFVKKVTNLSNFDVFSEGKNIRHQQRFKPGGTNVNFMEEFDDHIFVRTFERGVEDETLACGTGVTASALCYASEKKLSSGEINVKVLGGNLKVHFEKNTIFENIWLQGPAQFVYKGLILLT